MICLICGDRFVNGDLIIRLVLSELVDLKQEAFVYKTPNHMGEIHKKCFGGVKFEQQIITDEVGGTKEVERTNILSFLD
jgi:hypothetical protein